MYYSYRQIDSFNAPINIILGPRGVGKTFGALMKAVRAFDKSGAQMLYVVETKEMVKTLSQNKGEKFFSAILNFLRDSPKKKDNELLTRLFKSEGATYVEEEDEDNPTPNKIKGGCITMKGITAGYIVAFNDFADLKRNNFDGVKNIIIDEFIPENRDIRTLKNPYKIVSLIESVCRMRDVKIWLLGNTVNMNDPLLDAFGLCDIKTGEMRTLRDQHGLLAVSHRVDPDEYSEFNKARDASVAGRLASYLGLDQLNKNEFLNQMDTGLLIGPNPKSSHMAWLLHGPGGVVQINATKDYSTYYVMDCMSKSKNNHITVDQKYISNRIQYHPEYRDLFTRMLELDKLRFDTSMTYMIFKANLKLDIN